MKKLLPVTFVALCTLGLSGIAAADSSIAQPASADRRLCRGGHCQQGHETIGENRFHKHNENYAVGGGSDAGLPSLTTRQHWVSRGIPLGPLGKKPQK